MRGLEFECKKGYGSFLSALFQGVSINSYNWYIPESDVLLKDGAPIEIAHVLDGTKFKNFIHLPEYLIYNINLQAYPLGKEIDSPANYHEYVNSSSVLILFITDCSFGELYIKEESNLSIILENLITSDCFNIRIKTDKEDGRTRFSVW